ncbi:MAG: methyltransferase [Proteobacteria bacterium]|nr:methyltransferase [Pseudomonadota bacterium]
MRIIAGTLRGRVLAGPKGRDVRPTAARAREAVFNMLNSHANVDGVQVLDLFCGTGALGLEALSRGAAHVTFVDLDSQYAQQNVTKFGVTGTCTVIKANALRYKPLAPADIIFLDPPYNLGLTEKTLAMHASIGKSGTIWVVEAETGRIGPDLTHLGPFTHIAERTYGAGTITLLRQN